MNEPPISKCLRTAHGVPMFPGDYVRLLRTKRGLSQGELARMLSIVPSHVSRLESGERTVQRWLIQRMITVLSLTDEEALDFLACAGYLPDYHGPEGRLVPPPPDVDSRARTLAQRLDKLPNGQKVFWYRALEDLFGSPQPDAHLFFTFCRALFKLPSSARSIWLAAFMNQIDGAIKTLETTNTTNRRS